MPKTLSPIKPYRADHRVIRGILDTSHSGEVYHFPGEYDRVCLIFLKLGGSWTSIFMGNVTQVCKLKEIISYAVKHGYITKKPSWGKCDKPGEEKS